MFFCDQILCFGQSMACAIVITFFRLRFAVSGSLVRLAYRYAEGAVEYIAAFSRLFFLVLHVVYMTNLIRMSCSGCYCTHEDNNNSNQYHCNGFHLSDAVNVG